MFKDIITVLGTSGAIPIRNRKLSSYLLETEQDSILFDCGEGTQFQLFSFKKRIHKISKIFITHLHGDHLLGLPGLLSTMHLLDRNKPISIYGPEGIEEFINSINKIINSEPKFEIKFHIIKTDSKVVICENKKYSIYAFPLLHGMETYGYLYEQKKANPRINKDFIKENEIPNEWFSKIKKGEDFINNEGVVFANKDITKEADSPKSFAYCTDTAYFPQIVDYIKNVDLLYHEATFLIKNNKDAISKMHSTATDAANIAKDANVGKLIIGHFSARYKKLKLFEEEAKEIFENTNIVTEGLVIEL
ncbi:MAG: ribonuclease Z [Bacteroidales bacterium]|nr:ribonuclease Z [Bacteroidales bacterium]